jgi:MFS superfamily sulfate permease-like transporter
MPKPPTGVSRLLAGGWHLVEHHVPMLRWLPRYQLLRDGPGDCIAAASLAVLAAPEAISYAGIAGLHAVNGLYTAFIAPLAYAGLGSSPQLVTGPTTIMSILTRNAVPSSWAGVEVSSETTPALYVKLGALLALVTGLMQVLLFLLKAGFLARLISSPVIVGFTTGSALLIASTQFATLLGAAKCVGPGNASCTFVQAVSNVVSQGQAGKISYPVPLAALACLALLLGWKKGLPRLLPKRYALVGNAASLVLLLVSCAVMGSGSLGPTLRAHGIVAGDVIPAGLPAPSAPFPSAADTSGASASRDDIVGLLLRAVPLAVIGFMESLTIARTVARQYGPYTVDISQELLAVGFANVAVAIGQGYPVTGSFSRTAVNANSGARSPLSGALSGLILVVVLLTLTGPLSNLPKVATAAIVMVAILKLVEVGEMIRLWRSDKRDWLVCAVVFLVILLWDVAPALLIGISLQWLFGLTRGFALQSELAVWRGEVVLAEAPTNGCRSLGAPSAAGACPTTAGCPRLVVAQAAWRKVGCDEAVGPARRGAAQGGLLVDASRGSSIGRCSTSESDLSDAPLRPHAGGTASGSSGPGSSSSLVDAWGAMGGAGLSTSSTPPFPAAAATPLLAGAVPVHALLPPAAHRAAATGGDVTADAAGCSPRVACASLPVALLRFEPDLQFAEVARLSAHLEEVAGCYAPAAVVLDASRASSMDSTGAAHLLQEAEDAGSAPVAVRVRLQVRCAGGTGSAAGAQDASAVSLPAAAEVEVSLRGLLVLAGANRHVVKKLLRTAAARGYAISALPSSALALQPGQSGEATAAAAAAASPALRVGDLVVAETAEAGLALVQAVAAQRLRLAVAALGRAKAANDEGSVPEGAEDCDLLGPAATHSLHVSPEQRVEGFPLSAWSSHQQLRRRRLEPHMQAAAMPAERLETEAPQTNALPAGLGESQVHGSETAPNTGAASMAAPHLTSKASAQPVFPPLSPTVTYFRQLHAAVAKLQAGAALGGAAAGSDGSRSESEQQQPAAGSSAIVVRVGSSSPGPVAYAVAAPPAFGSLQQHGSGSGSGVAASSPGCGYVAVPYASIRRGTAADSPVTAVYDGAASRASLVGFELTAAASAAMAGASSSAASAGASQPAGSVERTAALGALPIPGADASALASRSQPLLSAEYPAAGLQAGTGAPHPRPVLAGRPHARSSSWLLTPLTPHPHTWLQRAVTATSPGAAVPATAAATPLATAASEAPSDAVPSQPPSAPVRSCGPASTTASAVSALLLAPLQTAVEAAQAVVSVAGVVSETRPFLQPG